MKINKPVTDHEVRLRPGRFVVTKTNLKGIITYVNQAFIETTGFSEQELVGKNHNVIRHPDMPPAVFQELWDTLKADKPWTGIVKNRCKNGDFYWVQANITPIHEGGRTTGYMSVRTTPSRTQIEAAESLYRKLRESGGSLAPTPDTSPESPPPLQRIGLRRT